MSQLRAQSIPCNPKLGHYHCIVPNKSWRRQLRDQTFCFSAWDWFFPSAAAKGWEWCKHNAELVERTAALRDLKLLVGSGGLDFPKGMDLWNKSSQRTWAAERLVAPTTQPKLCCDRHELLGWTKDSKFWVEKFYSEKSFESITDSQLKLRPWRWLSWIVTPNSIFHPYRLSDFFMSWMSLLERIAGMDSWNQSACHINLILAVHHIYRNRQLKGWQPCFQPIVAKSSISTMVHWFAAVTCHNKEHKHCIVTNLGDHNSVTKPSASLRETGFFL